LAGCATVAPFAPQTPAQGTEDQAQEIEPMLETAGFQSLPAVSAEQKDRLKALPALKLGYYVDGRGSANYWMADPEFCGCLYHGDETAYQRYQSLRKDESEAKLDRGAMMARGYQQPYLGSPGFGPGPGMGMGFGGPGMGSGGGFSFSF
jgi:hypothetical protein